MSDVRSEMIGLPQFAAQLKRLGAAASSDALEKAGQAALLLVQNAAMQKAPYLQALSGGAFTSRRLRRASIARIWPLAPTWFTRPSRNLAA